MSLSCENKRVAESERKAPATRAVRKKANQPPVQLHTDTLQFIHFEGNYDYWGGVFVNARKDTLLLVTDQMIADGFKNKLLEVHWFTDTLHEAGNDSMYAAKRLSRFKVVEGKLFVSPLTEEQILQDVRNMPEVHGGAEQVVIAERPAEGKEYYLIETGTREPDRFARLFMLRVYVYPKYDIRMYDPGKDSDMSLEEWRKQSQN